MRPGVLTRKDSPVLKKIRLVSSQARRAPPELVLAEGVRTLEEAARARWPVEILILSEKFGSSLREMELLSMWESAGIAPIRVSAAILRSVSSVVAPQGALALVRLPFRTLADIHLPKCPFIVAASEIRDPGNLGTLLRTAYAAGAHLFCTLPGTVSARNPKVIRSSAGAFFRMPLVENVSESAFLDLCRNRMLHAYRTSAHGGIEYFSADLFSGCAIILGNEGSGVCESRWQFLPAIHIPMAGGVESLNVAVAGAILMFEAHRQRSPAAHR